VMNWPGPPIRTDPAYAKITRSASVVGGCRLDFMSIPFIRPPGSTTRRPVGLAPYGSTRSPVSVNVNAQDHSRQLPTSGATSRLMAEGMTHYPSFDCGV
jgi:hypothetical protein